MPIVIGAVCTFAFLLVWRIALDPNPRSTLVKFDPQVERFFDVEGVLQPLTLMGPASNDALLVLGDSRASADISLRVLADHGIEPVCVLWGGLAQLDQLLRGARTLPQRRVLVCLDATGVYAPPMKRMTVLLQRERDKRVTQRFDERVDGLVGVFRQRAIRTIEAGQWAIDTVDVQLAPGRLGGMYAGLMDEKYRALRQASFETLRRDLRDLRDSGRRISCVRLPAEANVEAIEDTGFPGEQFKEMCAELGFPFLDLTGRNYSTSDGTHLIGAEAERMTVVLAEWLRDQQ